MCFLFLCLYVCALCVCVCFLFVCLYWCALCFHTGVTSCS